MIPEAPLHSSMVSVTRTLLRWPWPWPTEDLDIRLWDCDAFLPPCGSSGCCCDVSTGSAGGGGWYTNDMSQLLFDVGTTDAVMCPECIIALRPSIEVARALK